MTKKKKVTEQKDWRTPKGIKLKSTTKKFYYGQKFEADEYAHQRNSYVGEAIDEHGDFIGYYCPL
jgi:hypothetical protein